MRKRTRRCLVRAGADRGGTPLRDDDRVTSRDFDRPDYGAEVAGVVYVVQNDHQAVLLALGGGDHARDVRERECLGIRDDTLMSPALACTVELAFWSARHRHGSFGCGMLDVGDGGARGALSYQHA